MNIEHPCRLLLVQFLVLLIAISRLQSEVDDEFEDQTWDEWQAEFEALERELEDWLYDDPAASTRMYLLSVEAGLGYRDNVLLSSVNRNGHAFLHTGADFFFWSAPQPNERETSLFLFATNRTFLGGSVSDERTAALNGRITLEAAPNWNVILPLDIMLFDQVTDISTREAQFDALRVRGGRIGFQPGLAFQATESSTLHGRAIGRYSFFRSPLDNHRELGAGLTWRHDHDRNTDLELDLTLVHRRYASRQALEANGEPIPGRRLEFLIPKAEASVSHSWDPEQRWRSRTSIGIEANQDNGGGYFDFIRPLVAQRITYQHAPWRGEIFARASRYNYIEQTAGPDNTGPNLKRNAFDIGVKGVYSVNSRFDAFASANHERIDSNERDAGYFVNTVLTGIEVAF
jgi:hypothetical protein